MKTLQILIMLIQILLSSLLISCSNEKEPDFNPLNQINLDTVTFEHSMKGYELYSWPNGDGCNYSILPGTNRTKSLPEVTGNPLAVFGIDSLKRLLDRIPANENIFWEGEDWLERCWGYDYGYLSLPDEEIINEIMAYCNQRHLLLTVIN